MIQKLNSSGVDVTGIVGPVSVCVAIQHSV